MEHTGLAKSAPPIPSEQPQEAVIAPVPKPMEILSTPSWEGVPIDMIRYFGCDLGKLGTSEIQQLKDIDRWSKNGLPEDSIGNRLQKIRSLESRLGAPSLHETKLAKLWGWVKMDFSINELRKRQEAFESRGGLRDILR